MEGSKKFSRVCRVITVWRQKQGIHISLPDVFKYGSFVQVIVEGIDYKPKGRRTKSVR